MLGFEAYTLSLIRSTNWKLVDVELLGLFGFFDPSKKEKVKRVKQCKECNNRTHKSGSVATQDIKVQQRLRFHDPWNFTKPKYKKIIDFGNPFSDVLSSPSLSLCLYMYVFMRKTVAGA